MPRSSSIRCARSVFEDPGVWVDRHEDEMPRGNQRASNIPTVLVDGLEGRQQRRTRGTCQASLELDSGLTSSSSRWRTLAGLGGDRSVRGRLPCDTVSPCRKCTSSSISRPAGSSASIFILFRALTRVAIRQPTCSAWMTVGISAARSSSDISGSIWMRWLIGLSCVRTIN